MLCYFYELGGRKVLVYIFLLFLSLTRSGFALATEITMNFFPVILNPPFCHHLLSKSQSYAKSHSIFVWMFRANSQPQLPGGGCSKPDGVCVSTAAARWSWFFPLVLAATSHVLQRWLQPLFTLQMQATIILGTLVICVIYLVPLQILLSPE